jgi:hypothetical protein
MLGDAGTFLVHMMYVQHDSSTRLFWVTNLQLHMLGHRGSVIEYLLG